jgi:hypothetical protein
MIFEEIPNPAEGETDTSWDVRGVIPYLCRIPEIMMNCRSIVRDAKQNSHERVQDVLERAFELRNVFIHIANCRKWIKSSLRKIMAPENDCEMKRYLLNRDDLVTTTWT